MRKKEQGWSRDLLYQLVNTVRQYAVFAADLDGRVVSWNVGAELMFQYSADEAIGMDSDLLFTPDDRANNVPEAERQTAREKGYAEDERWHLRNDGSYFFASGIQTAVYDDKRHVGYVKIARDLTQRIRMEEELDAANRSVESKISQRTDELARSNKELRMEVTDRKRSEELRVALLRKIVTSQEGERKRIARDIHDHIGQQMTALRLKLSHLLSGDGHGSDLTNHLKELQKIADEIDSTVDFIAWELRPSVLDDLGVSAAVGKYIQEWTEHFNIPADFRQVGMAGKHLLPEIEINLYRIMQEALNNIAKHAGALGVSVLLERRDEVVSLIIEDDGAGFQADKHFASNNTGPGMGLLGMKERAELIGGTIEFESSPGAGTTVFVRAPADFTEFSGGNF